MPCDGVSARRHPTPRAGQALDQLVLFGDLTRERLALGHRQAVAREPVRLLVQAPLGLFEGLLFARRDRAGRRRPCVLATRLFSDLLIACRTLSECLAGHVIGLLLRKPRSRHRRSRAVRPPTLVFGRFTSPPVRRQAFNLLAILVRLAQVKFPFAQQQPVARHRLREARHALVHFGELAGLLRRDLSGRLRPVVQPGRICRGMAAC